MIIISFTTISYASDDIDLEEFNNEIRKYSSEFFPELENENILDSILKGDTTIEATNIISRAFNYILKEFRENLFLIFQILGISILCAIIKNIQSSFGEGGVSEVAFYVSYILVVILIITSFTNIMGICIDAIKNLSNFMNIIIPLVIALMLVTGNITTVAAIQPTLLVMTSLITNLVVNIIIPIIFISLVINIISNISDHVNISKIGDLLKKSSLWVTQIILIIFIGIISLEGSLASNVDGIVAKTAKTTVSSVIPVVGKVLGDVTDSVIGGMTITKNAVGTLGIIAILGIVIVPIMKVGILLISFCIATALTEPFSDARITKCMNSSAEVIKTLFGIMVTVTFLFIIAITLLLKVSNFSLMYR